MTKRMTMAALGVLLLVALAPVANWTSAAAPAAPAAVSSKPAEKDGLQVTVTLAKATFVAEPVEFTVQFKNVSQQPFNLFNIDHIENWQIRFAKQGPGKPEWHEYGFNVAGLRKLTVTKMAPGQVVAVPVVVNDLKGLARILSGGKEEQVKPGKYLLAIEMDQGDNHENDPKPGVKYWAGAVTTDPVVFEIAEKPAALSSKPAEKDGLQVTVTLPKAAFAADEQPKFTVKFKNVSDKPFALHDIDWFWDWSIRFDNLTSMGPWQLRLGAKVERAQDSVRTCVCKPGETVEMLVDLTSQAAFPFDFYWYGEQTKQPVPPQKQLEPGKYRLTVVVNLKEGPVRQNEVFWAGQITTNPLEFEIADKQDKADAAPALTVTIAEPLYQQQRALGVGGKESHFYVVVANVSKQPQKVWRDYCSWGYGNLTFKMIDEAGKETVLTKKLRDWDRNEPIYCVLEPGDLLVLDVRAAEWVNFPRPAADQGRKIRLQAVYEIKPDKEAEKDGVWTGRVFSETKEYVLTD